MAGDLGLTRSVPSVVDGDAPQPSTADEAQADGCSLDASWTAMSEPWMAGAACRGLTDLMFPERVNRAIIEARAVCDGCGVWRDCLDWSMTPNAPRDGILAGLTTRERNQLRRALPAPADLIADVTARRSVAGWWRGVPPQPAATTWTRDELLEARRRGAG